MSGVYFISDLHLGHAKVITFENDYRAKAMNMGMNPTIDMHDELIFSHWQSKVNKRDKVFVLGDLGYNVTRLKELPGTKILILGNHDKEKASTYLETFDDISGPIHYKGFWLSHHPIHPDELYGRDNIHGHTHSKGIADPRYINVCIEMCAGVPINFQDIKAGRYTTHERVNKPHTRLGVNKL